MNLYYLSILLAGACIGLALSGPGNGSSVSLWLRILAWIVGLGYAIGLLIYQAQGG